MLLLILVFMPFLAGILLFITGRRNERARDILAVVVCGLALLAAVAAPQVPDPSGALDNRTYKKVIKEVQNL